MRIKLYLQLNNPAWELIRIGKHSIGGHTALAMLKLVLAAAFILSLLAACRSPQQYPPCIGEKTQQLVFSWGNHDMATGKIDGYKLDAMGRLYSVERANDTSTYINTLINTLPDTVYCRANMMVTKEVMKIQTLNSAIDIERYVEYSNPETNAVMRASWNPKYETKGNKGFMLLFDYLNSLVDYGK